MNSSFVFSGQKLTKKIKVSLRVFVETKKKNSKNSNKKKIMG